jgi:hypothetical protein
MMAKTQYTPELLRMALIGFERQRTEVIDHINRIESALATGHAIGEPKKRRRLSAAARKRIAAAQKKRWSQWRQSRANKARKV